MSGTDDDDPQASFMAHDLATRMEEMHLGMRKSPKERTPKRTPRRIVKTIGDCKQADLVDINGTPYCIAFLIGDTAFLYPNSDVAIKPDGSNVLKLKKPQPAKLWKE